MKLSKIHIDEPSSGVLVTTEVQDDDEVQQGLVAGNVAVYTWVKTQVGALMRLMQTMSLLEDLTFNRYVIESLPPGARFELWKGLDRSVLNRIDLIRDLIESTDTVERIDRILEERRSRRTIRDLPPPEYSPEMRRLFREAYVKHVAKVEERRLIEGEENDDE